MCSGFWLFSFSLWTLNSPLPLRNDLVAVTCLLLWWNWAPWSWLPEVLRFCSGYSTCKAAFDTAPRHLVSTAGNRPPLFLPSLYPSQFLLQLLSLTKTSVTKSDTRAFFDSRVMGRVWVPPRKAQAFELQRTTWKLYSKNQVPRRSNKAMSNLSMTYSQGNIQII